MNRYISMLRGINVGGRKKIRMAELRAMYESLNFEGVQSYVQSGNVVFESSEGEPSALATLIEMAIQQTFGYEVSVFVRNVDEFTEVFHNNPFLNEPGAEPTKLHVTFLYQVPATPKLQMLTSPEDSTDQFLILNREIFLFFPDGYGRTKLSNQFFERKLGVAATTRNWRTVSALFQMANCQT